MSSVEQLQMLEHTGRSQGGPVFVQKERNNFGTKTKMPC